MRHMRQLGTAPIPEESKNLTAFLPTRSGQPNDSEYTPRVNWASFRDHAMIMPEHLAPDFRAGQLAASYVELHFTQQNAESLRLILVGDTVIGRGEASINLDYLDAELLGVSRQHILLRPTDKHLYLMDMDSTNGTLLNGILISPSRAYSLGGRDVITLGKLIFTLNIVGIRKSNETDLKPISDSKHPFA